jgi:hypothetical protein
VGERRPASHLNAERLRKYEAWIVELEARKASLARRAPGLRRAFLATLVLSGAGFLVSPWIGAGTSFTGVLIWVFGGYVLRVRLNEYADELRMAREEVARLMPIT